MKRLIISILTGLVALLLAVEAAGAEGTPARRVLVLPFTPLNADARASGNVWLSGGLQEAIVADLAHSPGLSPVSYSGDAPLDAAAALKTGLQSNVAIVVWGSFQIVSDQIRITGMVGNAATGEILGSSKVTGTSHDMLVAEDTLSDEIRAAVTGEPIPARAPPAPVAPAAAPVAAVALEEPTGVVIVPAAPVMGPLQAENMPEYVSDPVVFAATISGGGGWADYSGYAAGNPGYVSYGPTYISYGPSESYPPYGYGGYGYGYGYPLVGYGTGIGYGLSRFQGVGAGIGIINNGGRFRPRATPYIHNGPYINNGSRAALGMQGRGMTPVGFNAGPGGFGGTPGAFGAGGAMGGVRAGGMGPGRR